MILAIETGSRADAEEAFLLAAKLELHGVLLPLPALASEPAELTESEAGRLRQAATSAGVTIAGLTDVMAGAAHRLAGGDTSRAAALARLQAAIRLCTELGAKLICFELPAWETLRSRLRPDQARTLAAEVLRRCGPLAESRRVTLCVSGGEASSVEKFIHKVDHPNTRLASDGAALKRLAQPVRDARLVCARLGDSPKLLACSLAALGYNHWLALRLGGETDATAAQAWLKNFRAATSATTEG